MPQPTALAKAELRQLDANQNEVHKENWVMVQFNPESLKVSLANQLQTPSGAGDQNGTPARQYVGAGTTKLSLQLWFDITDPDSKEDDVRRLTRKVAFFITPAKGESEGQYIPPAVRFIWGSFQFDGLVDSMEESLELFSADGRPLRASVSLGLSQQKIDKYVIRAPGALTPVGRRPSTGTVPLTPAPAGGSVQGMAALVGRQAEWPDIAAANDIEDPLRLPPGRLVDLRTRKP